MSLREFLNLSYKINVRIKADVTVVVAREPSSYVCEGIKIRVNLCKRKSNDYLYK